MTVASAKNQRECGGLQMSLRDQRECSCRINCVQVKQGVVWPETGPRAWNRKLDGVLKENKFKRCKLEQAVYTKFTNEHLTIVVIYVDDLLVIGSSEKEITQFKLQMKQSYAKKILKMVGLDECNLTKFPIEPGLKLTKADERDDTMLGYNDSSYLVDLDDGKGTIGVVFYSNGRSKHINARFHYIYECLEKEQIKVEYVSGEEQRADILTKALPKLKFAEMRTLLGMERIEEAKT
ncbi:hypothetical protein E3N88_08000 [Mikania micrantha]|uniref:Reverse transcriptase Ty1/copia-type domain-containing protein n=1 Tax=Mikania micrantha TaxID=192012 RepID=A0A5N6PI37_9ASTR|nr:hypothetical protein E3N88_08000 [Mikania micrantha]